MKYLPLMKGVSHFFAFCLLLVLPFFAVAQSSLELCKNELLNPMMVSAGLQDSKLDFCIGDLENQPYNLLEKYDKTNFGGCYALDLVAEKDKFSAFVPAQKKNKLIRIDFDSLDSSIDLGDFGGLLNNPVSISVLKYQDAWLGFLINRRDLNLIILDFGQDIRSEPKVSSILIPADITMPNTIRAMKTFDDKIKVFIGDYKQNRITCLTWASLSEAPISEQLIVPIAKGGIFSLDIAKEGEELIIMLADGNRRLIKTHIPRENFSLASFDFEETNGKQIAPTTVRLQREAQKNFLFAQDGEGYFYRFTYDSSFSKPQIDSLGNFGVSGHSYLGLGLAKGGSEWKGAYISYRKQTLYTFEFPENCSAVPAFSTEPNPEVYYTEAGDYQIEQSGYDENGQLVSELYNVTVKDEAAPPAEIEASAFLSCVTSSFVFKVAEQVTGASYRWYVNGETFNGAALNYRFHSPDSYILRLDAESASGCTNSKSVTIHALAEPQPSFTPQFEGALCSNQLVNFANETGFTPDSVISYSWDFGDGEASGELSPEHRFEAAGTYLVKLTAEIPGCSAEYTQTLQVAEGPATAFAFSSNCLGEPTVFDNQTTGEGITAYRWDLGDGNFYNGENPTHRYQQPGTYLVKLEADNETGCTTSIIQSLHITDRPQAAFEVAPICEKNPVQFIDISQDAEGNVVNWQWNFGEAAEPAISTEQNPWVSFDKAGTYDVQLITESNFGCRDTINQTVSVSALPQPAMQLSAACVGETASLADISTTKEIRSRLWMVEGKAYTDSTFQLTFAEPGQYPVRLQLNLKNGCAVSLTDTLDILPLPTASLQAKQACANQQTSLWLEGSEDLSLLSWKIEGAEVAGSTPEVVYSFSEAGSYLVTAQYKNGNGCVNSLTTTLDVIPAPEAAFSLSADFGVTPMKVELSNESQRAVRYQWYINGAAEPVSAEVAPDFTFGEAGVYEVTLVAYNAAGCSNAYSQTLEAVPPYLDLALAELDVFELQGEGRIALTLDNLGYIPVEEAEIEIQLNEAIRLKETYTGLIEAGAAERYVLDARLQSAEAGAVQSVCVKVQPKLRYVNQEGNLQNNQECVSLSEQAVVHAPRPNPSSADVTLDLVLTRSENVSLTLYSLQGGKLWEGKHGELAAGLQRLNVPLQQFSKGIYLLQLEHDGVRETFRLNRL